MVLRNLLHNSLKKREMTKSRGRPKSRDCPVLRMRENEWRGEEGQEEDHQSSEREKGEEGKNLWLTGRETRERREEELERR